ncbi:condensation domain-containing protein, partial [Pseudoalteromonas holothuriae]|uniref:condensation domain-containing protein n=1 Tax=Pseudoalteromonas holothuriae TaxID=2963714 RepID=UPI0021C23806
MNQIDKLLNELIQVGVKVGITDDKNLRLTGNVEGLDTELISQIKKNKSAIINWTKSQKRTASARIIEARGEQAPPALASFSQQRLWFIDQLQGGSSEYNMPTALCVKGAFDIDVANRAMQRIIARHEILRTVLKETEQGTVQVVTEQVAFAFTSYDLSGLEALEREAAIQLHVAEHAKAAFVLNEDVMIRGAFINISTDPQQPEGIMLFNMHHIVSDGWSRGILVNEFVTLYDAFKQHKPDPLAPLAIQYADYAHWQHTYLKGEVLDEQQHYWQAQLADVPVVHG